MKIAVITCPTVILALLLETLNKLINLVMIKLILLLLQFYDDVLLQIVRLILIQLKFTKFNETC
jgi:hypothetical protein